MPILRSRSKDALPFAFLHVFYLIRKNNKGHIVNIVVIAMYVNKKNKKKLKKSC